MFGFLVFSNVDDSFLDWYQYDTKKEMLEEAAFFEKRERFYLDYFVTYTKEEIERDF